MKISYKRDFNSNYMIIGLKNIIENADTNDYKVGMIVSNYIPGMLKCNIRLIDGLVSFYYDITSKQPLERIYAKQRMTHEDLKIILNGIIKVIDSAEEFLLDYEDLLFDPEYIYLDIETKEPYFAYVLQDENTSFRKFTEYLLENIDNKDLKAVSMVYELYRKYSQDNMNLRTIIEEVVFCETNDNDVYKNKGERQPEKEKEIIVQPETKETVISRKKPLGNSTVKIILSIIIGIFAGVCIGTLIKVFMRDNINIETPKVVLGSVVVLSVVAYMIYTQHKNSKNIGNEVLVDTEGMDFDNIEKFEFMERFSDEKTIEDEKIEKEEVGSTTLLAYLPNERMLESVREPYKNLNIDKEVFLIGKMEKCVDGIIDNEMVSRIHAQIKKIGAQYYLTDFNSTNGTYCNGTRLEADETIELFEEDVIKFARVEYVFR